MTRIQKMTNDYPKTTNVYRYGFNGKENDDEVKGEGKQQDHGMIIYDTRLGKFLSVDPLSKDYPWFTPYQFASNMPIWAIDLDGEEADFSYLANYIWGDLGINTSTEDQIQTVVNEVANSKLVQASNGATNILLGAVGAVGCYAWMAGTSGAGVVAGGAAGLVLCKMEVAIGCAQVVDAFSDKPNENLQNSSTAVGYAMREKNIQGADYADAAVQFIPGMLTGGNILSVANSLNKLKQAENSIEAGLEVLQITDGVSDIWFFGKENANIMTQLIISCKTEANSSKEKSNSKDSSQKANKVKSQSAPKEIKSKKLTKKEKEGILKFVEKYDHKQNISN